MLINCTCIVLSMAVMSQTMFGNMLCLISCIFFYNDYFVMVLRIVIIVIIFQFPKMA